MTGRRGTIRVACRSTRAFTLVELLVVMAVVSLLMAILLPALGKCRVLARRVICRSNIRQIYIGWQVYFEGNNQQIYTGVNANVEFGGWQGRGGFAAYRPINRYLDMDSNSECSARVFLCPADSGGILSRPPQEKAYQYYGNSYQANPLLVWPPPASGQFAKLYREIAERTPELTRTEVSEPARLLFYGDCNWVTQWNPAFPIGVDWHGKAGHYNLAFFDGHTDLLRIEKGLFIGSGYRILPFNDLDPLVQPSQP